MCRLFGFKASRSTNIRFSLAHAPNAIRAQSASSADGWGIGFYAAHVARVIKRPISAEEDTTFIRLSDKIRSDTVVAHLRKGTVGGVNTLNCHPFQYHNWMLAHNGTLEKATEIRALILQDLSPKLQENVRGATDSELCFHIFLDILQREFHADLDDPKLSSNLIFQALRSAIHCMDRLGERAGATLVSRLNFMLTNGQVMLAARRGHALFTLERSNRSDIASMYGPLMGSSGLNMSLDVMLQEEEAADTPRRSVLIASEPISTESWQMVQQDSVVIVEADCEWRAQPLDSLNAAGRDRLEMFIWKRMYDNMQRDNNA